jgi:hypothetical protein
MKSTVAIYNSHLKALDAVRMLKNKSYPVNQVSILAQAKIVDNEKPIEMKESLKNIDVSVGVVLDSTLSVLSRARILKVPGLGFVLGAGAITAAIGHFYIGMAGVGLITILAEIGIKNDKVQTYSKHLKEGKFLVIAQGNEEEMGKAKNILCDCGEHIELCMY